MEQKMKPLFKLWPWLTLLVKIISLICQEQFILRPEEMFNSKSNKAVNPGVYKQVQNS